MKSRKGFFRVHRSHLFALLFIASIGQAHAIDIVIAGARGDFVAGTNEGDPGIMSAAGTGTWQYLASDFANPTLDGTLDVLTWRVPNGAYYKFTSGGSANTVGLTSVLPLASDKIWMHPSGRSPRFDVIRWIPGAGEVGVVNITGHIRKRHHGGGGVTFDLFVDSSSVFNTTLTGNDSGGVSFDLTVPDAAMKGEVLITGREMGGILRAINTP